MINQIADNPFLLNYICEGREEQNHGLLNPKLQLFPLHAIIRLIIFVPRKG